MEHWEYDTRLAAYAVLVDEDQRILLTWYNGLGRGEPAWSLPGGGIDFGESIAEGLRREVHEEAGYQVEVGDPLLVDTFTVDRDPRTGRPFRGIRILCAARITGGELGTTETGGSTDFARWVPLAGVEELPQKRASIVDLAVGIARDSTR